MTTKKTCLGFVISLVFVIFVPERVPVDRLASLAGLVDVNQICLDHQEILLP
jgi:hypothetical protein